MSLIRKIRDLLDFLGFPEVLSLYKGVCIQTIKGTLISMRDLIDF